MKSTFTALVLSLLVTFAVSSDAQARNVPTQANPVPAAVVPTLEKAKDLKPKQLEKLDFTGTWTGMRYQYNDEHTGVARDYTYTFELVQEGDRVTGTSTIVGAEGDFAVIKLTGTIIDDKLHFQEFAINEQEKNPNMVWCYKVGELQLGKVKGKVVAYGPTASYTSTFYLPCSGGFTMLEKVEENKPMVIVEAEDDGIVDVATKENVTVTAYPNPFVEQVTIDYSIEKADMVKVEIFEINGQHIATLHDGQQNAGSHKVDFNSKNYGYSAGVFFVKLTVGDEVFSKQIVQMN